MRRSASRLYVATLDLMCALMGTNAARGDTPTSFLAASTLRQALMGTIGTRANSSEPTLPPPLPLHLPSQP